MRPKLIEERLKEHTKATAVTHEANTWTGGIVHSSQPVHTSQHTKKVWDESFWRCSLITFYTLLDLFSFACTFWDTGPTNAWFIRPNFDLQEMSGNRHVILKAEVRKPFALSWCPRCSDNEYCHQESSYNLWTKDLKLQGWTAAWERPLRILPSPHHRHPLLRGLRWGVVMSTIDQTQVQGHQHQRQCSEIWPTASPEKSHRAPSLFAHELQHLCVACLTRSFCGVHIKLSWASRSCNAPTQQANVCVVIHEGWRR